MPTGGGSENTRSMRIQGAHAASVTPRGLHPELVLSSDIALAGGLSELGPSPTGQPLGLLSYHQLSRWAWDERYFCGINILKFE